jgi:8-oxo-dGTP pyrophosphatase MutT (NUDIX family)
MIRDAVDLSLERVRAVLSARRPIRSAIPALRPAAVLVALFAHPADGTTHVWLLRRAQDGGPHSGQVALPGGKACAKDAELLDTALREAGEELGFPREQVEILGRLDDFPTITRYRITPFVGWVPSELEPRLDAREVARAFPAPLSVFFERGARSWVRWSAVRRLVRSYEVEGEVVWGATAAILAKLVQILAGE